MNRNTLFVFAKPNRMGVSKTRLARDIGPSEAHRLNAMTTARVLRAVSDPRWHTILCVSPDRLSEKGAPNWPRHLDRQPQGSGTLGDRMRRAFHSAPHGKLAFVGTDMPDLTPHLIWRAFQLLNSNDAVFGPANDGGFWLFAQNKLTASRPPFHPVRWSTSFALDDVRRNLSPARIAYLTEMVDLDELSSLRLWKQRHQHSS